MRGQKDYELALKDLQEAKILYPDDADVDKLTNLTLEDIELDKRIRKIMGSSELLKGKEYLDFVIDFLLGKKDESPPAVDPKATEKQYCFHEITEEEAGKMKSTLSTDKDICYYFNAKDGLKILVASLKFNTNGLEII